MKKIVCTDKVVVIDMKTDQVIDKNRNIKQLKFDIKYFQDQIEKFKEDFTKDPHYALSWGMGAFETASKLRAHLLLQLYISKMDWSLEEAVKAFIQENTKEVLRGAKYPPRSTSVTSNLAEQCYISALADLIEKVSHWKF